MITNLHITASPVEHPTRILKETSTLLESGKVSRVYVAALQQEGEKEVEELGDHRTIWRIPLLSRPLPKHVLPQAIKLIEYSLRVARRARKHKVNLVNVHNVGALPLGVAVKWLCGAKLVYDTHELETETYGKHGFHKFASQIFERLFIRFADLVIVVGDAIERWYRDAYGTSNIITVLNCPNFRHPRPTQLLRHELGIPLEKKILIYQGGLWRGRGIEKLLDAFAEVRDERFVLVCMGYGELDALIKDYAKRHDNIYLQKAAAPSEVLEYTSSADYGIAYIDNPSLNDQYCLPNKFFEYIMAGLPVLVNDAPEMKRFVKEFNIGEVLTELTTDSLQTALGSITSQDSQDLAANLRRVAEACSWEKQASKMMDSYDKYVFGS